MQHYEKRSVNLSMTLDQARGPVELPQGQPGLKGPFEVVIKRAETCLHFGNL